jgi:DNA-binding CsgD family transcriptional regulator
VTSVLLLGRAEIEVLSARHEEAERTLRQVADLAPPENSQFQQQLRAWEAELRLWFPVAGGAAHPGHLQSGLGSDVVGDEGEDLPLTLRLMWLGVRSDADAAARATFDVDGARRRALTADGTALAARARHLATSTMTGGMRRQVDGYFALIGAEESRLHDLLEPERWKRAAETNDADPYLRTYALWRQAGALQSLRRRREAVTLLRQAYDIAEPLGIRVLVEAVTIAGLSLNVRLDEPQEVRLPKARTASPYNLTAKEQEVLALLVRGFTNRRIGSTLRMTEKTASVHVSRILAKLSVGSRGEAVARAYELGLVSLSTGR